MSDQTETTLKPIDDAPKSKRLLILWDKRNGFYLGNWFEARVEDGGWWTSHAMKVEPTHFDFLPALP